MSEIESLGSRLNSGFCLKCGTTLLEPWNDLQCCAVCTDMILRISHEAKHHKSKKKKSGKERVVVRPAIKRQVLPIGVPVK